MKKIVLLLLALMPVLNLAAQQNWEDPAKAFDGYWMVGARYGLSQFTGDINGKNFFSKLNKESKSSFALSVSRQVSPVISLKAEYAKSWFFSKTKLSYLGEVSDMSYSGDANEMGIYGSLNLNKLFAKDKATAGINWYAYLSSGFGVAAWRGKLKNDDTYQIVDSIGYNDAGKSARMSALTVPLALGVHFLLADGIWFTAEHAIHFVNSDRMDMYINNYNDKYTTTTFGITIKLQKLASIRLGRGGDAAATSTAVQNKISGSTSSSSRWRKSKTQPELQEYTGYNALLPRETPKTDTAHAVKIAPTPAKDNWVAAVDSGRFEITGGGKATDFTKEAEVGAEPQAGLVAVYRIQIQASKTYIPMASVVEKRGLAEKVSVELRNDGWYRYYVGQFTDMNQAKSKLAELRSKGIKDSFVVCFSGKERKVLK